MSALNSKLTQALFPLLTATLLATACTESTSPSTEGEAVTLGSGATAAPQGATTAAPQGTTPVGVAPVKPTTASLKQNGWWVKAPVLRPGYLNVTFPTVCISKPALGKSVSVTGVQVTNLPDWENGQARAWQKVMVRTLLWRWNPTSRIWQTVRYQDWWSPNQQDVFGINWMTVPSAGFSNLSAGYYSVTVEAYWYPFQALMAFRSYSLNLKAEYAPIGNAQAFDGSCYLY